jgi:5'-nucleotidase
MADPPLGKARILLSNDDGIEAPGLKILERVARAISDDIWVVAPEAEQSAASHSLTLRIPLRIREISPRRFAINGTPTDSVLLAVRHILKDRKPDLLLSGVNRGGNLGEDVTYSGTIAAAMEGTLLGVRSIALSQNMTRGERTPWSTAEAHAGALIRKLYAVKWQKGVLINVNFPDRPADQVKEVQVAPLGRREIAGELDRRLDPRGVPYYWITTMRGEKAVGRGSDLAAVARGAISVTPLSVDLTHRSTMRALKQVLG